MVSALVINNQACMLNNFPLAASTDMYKLLVAFSGSKYVCIYIYIYSSLLSYFIRFLMSCNQAWGTDDYIFVPQLL